MDDYDLRVYSEEDDNSRHGWTHPICEPCYAEIEPGRIPARLKDPDQETCCWCERATTSGIYYRDDWRKLPCNGMDLVPVERSP